MNRAEKLSELRILRDGQPIKVVLSTKTIFGFHLWENVTWISIEEGHEHYFVLMCNREHSHDRLGGPAYGADFNMSTGERSRHYGGTGAWETAISLWQIRDQEKAIAVFNRVGHAVDLAYEQIVMREEIRTTNLLSRS